MDAKQQTETPAWRTTWPLYLIALGAFVAIWGGWVGLGELTGFGPVRLFPGIFDDFVLNSAITLPLGMEAYAALALRWWLAPRGHVDDTARTFAGWSVVGALILGAAGQVAYHLMKAAGVVVAPWGITAAVSCLPVIVLGCGAALIHLIHRGRSAEPVGQPTEEKQSVVTVGEHVAARTDGFEREVAELLGSHTDPEWPAGEEEDPTAEPTVADRPLVIPPMSDDDITAEAKEWARELRRPPSRDEMLARYSIGATRCRRLRKLLGWHDEPTVADRTADRKTVSRPSAA